MSHHQPIHKKNAGFTLVEVMVVILIISILVALGNYGDFSQRREKARLEELTVQLIALIDQEKTNTLLGKTESEAIVRKRKVTLEFSNNTLTYRSYLDLAEDQEDTYCGAPGNCDDTIVPGGPNTNTALMTKSWEFFDPALVATLHSCDTGSPAPMNLDIKIVMQGDTMVFQDSGSNPITDNHIVLHLSRLTHYREIHIDKRTGLTYERESSTSTPSCN